MSRVPIGDLAYSSGEDEPSDDENDDFDFFVEDDLEYIPGHEIFYNNDFHSSIKDFTGSPSHIVENTPLEGHEPINYFDLFMDENLLDLIVRETNLYQSQNPEPARQKMRAWEDLGKDELKKFLGLTILMGHVKKVALDDYWSRNPLLVTPIFNQTMPRNRFEQILRFLHFHNNETPLNHPLKKIKTIIDDLNAKFANFLEPGRNLCIDESLLLWKGRLRFKQFLPLKRSRFGIKIFEIVDCQTGFVLGFIVYTGADTDYEKFGLGISGDVVAHFLRPYFGKGHIVFVDNWYSSPALAEFLHEKDTGLCGTVRKNRKGLPKFTEKLKKGETQVGHNMIWLALKWQDKKEVWMITTVSRLEYASSGKQDFVTGEEIIKPSCIIDYNKNMGGVDNVDRQLAITASIRKSLKWYRKLFFHLIDLILINAHALYKLQEGAISFTDFRMKVISSLLGVDSTVQAEVDPPPSRLTGRHFPTQSQSTKECTMCRASKVRRRTKYYCGKCQAALCAVPCFEQYHTQRSVHC